MYRFRVRPGYGSDKLLVEFMSDSTDAPFVEALRSVFSANGVESERKVQSIFHHESFMHSSAGPFVVVHDEWCQIWVHADDNQAAISFVDGILVASGRFEKEAVDFRQYAEQVADGNRPQAPQLPDNR